jgi:hypothetical protein
LITRFESGLILAVAPDGLPKQAGGIDRSRLVMLAWNSGLIVVNLTMGLPRGFSAEFSGFPLVGFGSFAMIRSIKWFISSNGKSFIDFYFENEPVI